MKLLNFANLRSLFGGAPRVDRVPSAPAEGLLMLPLIAEHAYMRTLVREQEGGSFKTSSLFLRGVPEMPLQPLIDAVQEALPDKGSFLVLNGYDADESFDYNTIEVIPFDLLNKQQVEDLAGAIDKKLRSMVEAKPAPSQDSKVKLQPA